jgi:hypothetical protein
MKTSIETFLVACLMLVITIAANKNNGIVKPATFTANVPEVFKKMYGVSSVSVDGDYVIIKSTSLPDHRSPYYQGTQWEAARYEDYNGKNAQWRKNPNRITENDFTYRIPINPLVAKSHHATPMGAIGVAVNGVPIFNQYAAMRTPLTREVNGFDQYGGHPQQFGVYHYHAEPYYITGNKGKDALIGFLVDGFPVYGPAEGGKTITNTDLDVYHGHFGPTADYPKSIYHYHITAADPYINGDGFYGNPGTVSY